MGRPGAVGAVIVMLFELEVAAFADGVVLAGLEMDLSVVDLAEVAVLLLASEHIDHRGLDVAGV